MSSRTISEEDEEEVKEDEVREQEEVEEEEDGEEQEEKREKGGVLSWPAFQLDGITRCQNDSIFTGLGCDIRGKSSARMFLSLKSASIS